MYTFHTIKVMLPCIALRRSSLSLLHHCSATALGARVSGLSATLPRFPSIQRVNLSSSFLLHFKPTKCIKYEYREGKKGWPVPTCSCRRDEFTPPRVRLFYHPCKLSISRQFWICFLNIVSLRGRQPHILFHFAGAPKRIKISR